MQNGAINNKRLEKPLSRLRYTVPNSFTALSLLLGVSSIVTTQLGELELAGWLIVWCGLLDVMDGLSATKLISHNLPEIKVVVLTASTEDADLFEAIKCGAEGYLLKDLEAEKFLPLLEGVARGEPALTPLLARKLLHEFKSPKTAPPKDDDPDALTAREMEVLEWMVQGVTSNRALARKLGVSENTVKFHVRNILDKLHLHNRAQVVAYALRHGMVEMPADEE